MYQSFLKKLFTNQTDHQIKYIKEWQSEFHPTLVSKGYTTKWYRNLYFTTTMDFYRSGLDNQSCLIQGGDREVLRLSNACFEYVFKTSINKSTSTIIILDFLNRLQFIQNGSHRIPRKVFSNASCDIQIGEVGYTLRSCPLHSGLIKKYLISAMLQPTILYIPRQYNNPNRSPIFLGYDTELSQIEALAFQRLKILNNQNYKVCFGSAPKKYYIFIYGSEIWLEQVKDLLKAFNSSFYHPTDTPVTQFILFVSGDSFISNKFPQVDDLVNWVDSYIFCQKHIYKIYKKTPIFK